MVGVSNLRLLRWRSAVCASVVCGLCERDGSPCERGLLAVRAWVAHCASVDCGLCEHRLWVVRVWVFSNKNKKREEEEENEEEQQQQHQQQQITLKRRRKTRL